MKKINETYFIELDDVGVSHFFKNFDLSSYTFDVFFLFYSSFFKYFYGYLYVFEFKQLWF